MTPRRDATTARPPSLGSFGERFVFVAGGAGLVGAAIVRALAASPAVAGIAVASRTASRLDALRATLDSVQNGRVLTLVGDAGDPDDAVRLVTRALERCGRIDVAVASLGAGEADGRALLDVDAASYARLMHEMLGTHVAFARATIPRLAPSGTYLGIGGGAAFGPMPGGGVISMAAAAQAMMTRVLDAERTRPDVTIRELIVNAPISIDGATPPGAIGAGEVGAVVEELIRTGTSAWPRFAGDGPLLTMHPRRAGAPG
jgi:NAD(P)-dependent dehydrogenase (short-subunit alcohol dehydrogenase family)